MRRPSRLALRIYLIGLAQLAALTTVLWLTRPVPAPPPPLMPLARREPPPGLAAKLVAVSLVLVGISAVLTAMWLGRALEKLSAAARALGAGNLSTRTDLRRNDELGDVAVAFDEMADRIEQLVRAHRELLANVSHELRTPLARIRVALDLASEGGAAEAPSSLSGIAGDLGEVERLIEDILTSARLELTNDAERSAAPPLRIDRIEAQVLLEDAARRFRELHPSRDLRVQLGSPASRLEADRMLLRRAIDNLLDNAAKHSETETPITLAAGEAEGRLSIEVRDQGRGMAPDDLKRLFTPFFRADRSRTRQTGGLGLGLVLARRIVEAHRGTLVVESAPGQGTVARVCVPLAK